MSKERIDGLREVAERLEELRESLEAEEGATDFREAVIREVDKWDIEVLGSDGNPVSYSDKIKPLVYGIGIDVVTRSRDLKRELLGSEDSYLDYPLEEAKDRFKRDFLIAVYIRSGCDSRKAAESMGYSSDDVFRHETNHIGIKLIDVRKNQDKFPHLTADRDKAKGKLKECTKNRILEYKGFLRPLARKLIDKYVDFMAERFVGIVFTVETGDFDMSEYTTLRLDEARDKFNSWYYTQQFVRTGGNTAKAAKYAEVTQEAVRQFFFRNGMSMGELRSKYGL